MRQLLPEWTPQWGVLLAWPDAHTDWADHLADAETCYLDILAALLDHEHVLLVAVTPTPVNIFTLRSLHGASTPSACRW